MIDEAVTLQQVGECIADTSRPNLGCLPLVGSGYVGGSSVSIGLPDVNGNGADDAIKLTYLLFMVDDLTNTVIQGADLIDTFNSTIEGSGSVGDAGTDPPFSFTLTGPTTAQQGIVYQAQVPAPGTLALIAAGIGLFGWQRRCKAA